MHIPDGYLSPATCVTLYAAAAPFWAVAMRRIRALLMTRTVPLISLFAAFSFVIMMFNLPLPGGTTGHATGVAVAAVVLGPWASILAVSVALAIQAVFFGDGGITALGANCFNIAITGSLVAHWTYSAIAGRSAFDSRRRVVGAALAGYLAINAAALLTAVQFGIQPLLFSAPDGTPLYAPYALDIAVPAMMLGHLTFAGLAEAIVAAGIVAYLQRAEPALLTGARPVPIHATAGLVAQRTRSTTRALWAGLGVLLVATPLGLLAAGTAWGEWSADDFADPESRAEIRQASLDAPPPAEVPRGLARIASFWSAPIPDYAPGFIRSESFGYVLSGVFGTGIVILSILLLQALSGRMRVGGSVS